METKWTPGPWHWESDAVKNYPIGRIRYRVTALGKTVTQVYYSSFEGGPTSAEHDARLISAAPDLLAALEAVLDQIDPQNTTVGLGIIMRAHEAIAKARGQK